MSMMKWFPEEFLKLQDYMGHAIDDVVNRNRKGEFIKDFLPQEWLPRTNIVEEGDKFVFTFDLPGIDKENIDVKYEGKMLIVKGERKETKEEVKKNFIRKESHFGSFYRAFPLDIEIDENNIKATYKDGILEVTVPKSEKILPRQVKVKID